MNGVLLENEAWDVKQPHNTLSLMLIRCEHLQSPRRCSLFVCKGVLKFEISIQAQQHFVESIRMWNVQLCEGSTYSFVCTPSTQREREISHAPSVSVSFHPLRALRTSIVSTAYRTHDRTFHIVSNLILTARSRLHGDVWCNTS